MTKKTGFVPTTFRDAGTDEVFEGGKSHDFDAGAFANYQAAGLIIDKGATAKAASSKPAKPKGSKPKAAKPAKAAPTATSLAGAADTANTAEA